jgi:hypothetical protein
VPLRVRRHGCGGEGGALGGTARPAKIRVILHETTWRAWFEGPV